MKKIYEQPSVECTRIVAEAVMNQTGIDGGQVGVVPASDYYQE